jgi:serine protease Do
MLTSKVPKIAAIGVLAVASLPAQTRGDWQSSADSWRSYSQAWRHWGDHIRDYYRYAFQTPRAAAPVIVGPGGVVGLSRSFLGVHVVEIDSAKAASLKLKDEVGVEITSVETDSPAEKAGLKVGDVVQEYQGQRVEGTEQFIRLVRETPVGRQVKMSVHRAGATQTITATIGSRKSRLMAEFPRPGEAPRVELWMPDMPRAYTGLRSARIGVEAEGLSGQLAEYFGVKEGVLVRSVMKGSAAEKGGLKAGDVITKVDQKPLDSPRDLSEALRDKKSVSITVMREKREMSLTVTPEEGGGDGPARAVVRREEYKF